MMKVGAGIVDQMRNRSPPRRDRLNYVRNVCGVRRIARDADDLATGFFLAQSLNGLLQNFRAAPRDDDFGILTEKKFRNGSTNPGASTGNPSNHHPPSTAST